MNGMISGFPFLGKKTSVFSYKKIDGPAHEPMLAVKEVMYFLLRVLLSVDKHGYMVLVIGCKPVYYTCQKRPTILIYHAPTKRRKSKLKHSTTRSSPTA